MDEYLRDLLNEMVKMQAEKSKRKVSKPVVTTFDVDPAGGSGFRKLRDEEYAALRDKLNEFNDKATRISAQEIEFKRELVQMIVEKLRESTLKGYVFKVFNAGSAYERVQAGEAKDFDVLLYLNVKKWTWKVVDDPERPSYCWITRGEPRESDKPNSFTHYLDAEGRLSSLKVRKLFASRVDKFLRKICPLEFEYKRSSAVLVTEGTEGRVNDTVGGVNGTVGEVEGVVGGVEGAVGGVAGAVGGAVSETTDDGATGVESEMETYRVHIRRKYQGPATTLEVKCNGMEFTIDLVNSLHGTQVRSGEKCDFIAKPFDKQKIFGTEYQHLWRKAYSRWESHELKSISDNDGVHRKLLRIFKTLRTNQSQLKLLKSYVYKNLVFYSAKLTDRGWKEKDLAHRFVDMVITLRNCLENYHLPAYFDESINLLQQKEDEYKAEHLKHITGYLRRIANKGIEGYIDLLTVRQQPVAAVRPPAESVDDGPPSKKKMQMVDEISTITVKYEAEGVQKAEKLLGKPKGNKKESKIVRKTKALKTKRPSSAKQPQHSKKREIRKKRQKATTKGLANTTNPDQQSKQGKKKVTFERTATSRRTEAKRRHTANTSSGVIKTRASSTQHGPIDLTNWEPETWEGLIDNIQDLQLLLDDDDFRETN